MFVSLLPDLVALEPGFAADPLDCISLLELAGAFAQLSLKASGRVEIPEKHVLTATPDDSNFIGRSGHTDGMIAAAEIIDCEAFRKSVVSHVLTVPTVVLLIRNKLNAKALTDCLEGVEIVDLQFYFGYMAHLYRSIS